MDDEPRPRPEAEAASQPPTEEFDRVAGAMPTTGGAYRIVASIGSGGFGDVYLAEQLAPIRRRVALKLLRPGMESGPILARFEAERQALALMDHPNVAKVFDAGTTRDGRPYFVMEHVQGVAITDHCDRQRLGVEERLRLFLQACSAIQHAHQKGIIHRDIKPSNILVAVGDVGAHVKVIDFGVAKAVGAPLVEAAAVTQVGQLIGTPAYMSPEQAERTAQDIDTRSDIYSLGVVLYELLAGALPVDPAELRGADRTELVRVIREKEPPRPSTRVSTMRETSGAVASRHGTDPQTLCRQLRGDLDWVTMKAMDKDRTRRYGSVSELAADIERHLRDEPVLAGPPTLAYRARKFARRNRLLVAGVAVVAVSLVAGAVTSTLFAVGQARARARAEAESAKARAAVDFLRTMLSAADPNVADSNVRVLDVVDRAADDLRRGVVRDPAVEATVRAALGATYLGLGRLDEAKEHLDASYHARLSLYGPDSLDVADGLNQLGWLALARDDQATAERLVRRSLDIMERRLKTPDPRLADVMHNLGVILKDEGKLDAAEAMFRRSMAVSESLAVPNDPNLALTMSRLGTLLALRGKLAESETLQRRAVAMLAGNGSRPHVRVVEAMENLAWLLQQTGRAEEAEHLAAEAVRVCSERYGADSGMAAQALVSLAIAQRSRGSLAAADASLRRALDIYRRTYGERHSFVAGTLDHLAGVALDRGELTRAAALFTQVIGLYTEIYGDRHWLVGNARSRYGACLLRLRRYDQAEVELRTAYGILVEAGFSDRAAPTARQLANLYDATGRPSDAAAWRTRGRTDPAPAAGD